MKTKGKIQKLPINASIANKNQGYHHCGREEEEKEEENLKKKKKKESELVQLSFLLVLVNFGRQMMIDGLIAYLKELEKLQHSSKLSL